MVCPPSHHDHEIKSIGKKTVSKIETYSKIGKKLQNIIKKNVWNCIFYFLWEDEYQIVSNVKILYICFHQGDIKLFLRKLFEYFEDYMISIEQFKTNRICFINNLFLQKKQTHTKSYQPLDLITSCTERGRRIREQIVSLSGLRGRWSIEGGSAIISVDTLKYFYFDWKNEIVVFASILIYFLIWSC